MILEVCAGSIASAIAAAKGGAQRIELCAALETDGLTPSIGTIKQARAIEGLTMNVLIRPREGDFCYSEEEIQVMEHDIKKCLSLGVDGVVIGALTPQKDIDIECCKRLVKAAGKMQVTFHRAFDQCNAPLKALEQIIELGCNRLLTSGQKPTAEEGLSLLQQLVAQANDRIIILPGTGVNPDNARKILSESGAKEIHASARSLQNGRKETDANIVKAILSNCSGL